mgnify:CR=1 FL=1
MEKKGLDRCFMQYGIRQNDIKIIEQVCEDHDVDSAWLEEHVLKVYQEKKNANTPMKQTINKQMRRFIYFSVIYCNTSVNFYR